MQNQQRPSQPKIPAFDHLLWVQAVLCARIVTLVLASILGATATWVELFFHGVFLAVCAAFVVIVGSELIRLEYWRWYCRTFRTHSSTSGGGCSSRGGPSIVANNFATTCVGGYRPTIRTLQTLCNSESRCGVDPPCAENNIVQENVRATILSDVPEKNLHHDGQTVRSGSRSQSQIKIMSLLQRLWIDTTIQDDSTAAEDINEDESWNYRRTAAPWATISEPIPNTVERLEPPPISTNEPKLLVVEMTAKRDKNV